MPDERILQDPPVEENQALVIPAEEDQILETPAPEEQTAEDQLAEKEAAVEEAAAEQTDEEQTNGRLHLPARSEGNGQSEILPKKKNGERVYAGFFVRLTAFILDKIIVGLVLIVLRLAFMVFLSGSVSDILARKVFFSVSLSDAIIYLLTAAYFVLLTYYTGGTVGKKMMKIRVVSAEDRQPTFFEIAFREIIGRYLSAFILYIGYLIIGAGSQKEALHDHLADTRVVYDAGN